MTLQAKFTGGPELQKALGKLPVDVERKFGMQAIRAGARVILKEAKRLVPVRTGALRKSLGIIAMPKKSGVVGVYVGTRKGKGRAFYGHLIEFGTAKTPARPFLRPAVDTKQDEAVRTAGRKLFDLIKKGIRR